MVLGQTRLLLIICRYLNILKDQRIIIKKLLHYNVEHSIEKQIYATFVFSLNL